MAFIDEVPYYYQIIDNIIDAVIVLDILITFRTAYKNKDDIIVDHWYPICINYLKTWFILDVMAVFPYHWLLSSDSKNQNYNTVF